MTPQSIKNPAIKVGIAGIGHMGKYHVNLLTEIISADNVFIYDIDQEKCKQVAKDFKVNACTTYSDMLQNVEAVIIVVPTCFHYEYAMEAMKKGCHILVEKPISDSLADAYAIMEFAKQSDLVLHVGHIERFNDAIHEVRHLLNNPRYINTQRIGSVTRIQDVGVVLDLMIHDIDLVLSLVKSKVREITAHGQSVITDFEDYALATLHFENGCVANLIASRVSSFKDRRMIISQQDSYIQLDYASHDILVYKNQDNTYDVSQGKIKYREEHVVDRVFVLKGNPLEKELRYFLDTVTGEEKIAEKYGVMPWNDDSNLYTMEIAFKILEKIKQNMK
ncbi:MAG: Gfo/Idh/MocA family oxidoreductase [Brevinema sp.]